MTRKEAEAMAEMIEHADLVMLVMGDKKAGLGKDIQQWLVDALRLATKIHQRPDD